LTVESGVRFWVPLDERAPEKMFQWKQIGDAAKRHRVLLIGCESFACQDVTQFLHMAGCTCTVVSSREALISLEQESFDAILIDSTHSEAPLEQFVLAVKNVQPALLGRILLITGTEPANGMHILPSISREKPLSQLWTKLQEILVAGEAPNLAPPGMQIPQLMFDSFNSPMAAGMRGSPRSDRQLVYLHSNTTVNLLIRLMEGAYQIALLGQVLDVSLRVVHGLPVLLRYQNITLAQTNTTEFGEFGLHYDFVEHAGLQIQLAEGSWIYMPLELTNWRRNST
jgi:hypothetical protein